MAENVEGKPGGRLLRALDAVPALVWVAIGALVVVGIVGLFGGLAPAQRAADEITVLGVGEEHVGPQFSVAVHDATVMQIAPGFNIEADEGNEYLVVNVTLTNNYVASTTSLQDAIALEWLDDDHSDVDRVVVVSDGTSLAQAHPHVPVDLAIIWQVPRDSIAEGDTLQVSVMEASLRTDSELTFGAYWYDPLPVAHVDVVASIAPESGDTE